MLFILGIVVGEDAGHNHYHVRGDRNKVHENNPSMDTETLELKLSEAILKETPKLESGLTLLKIISAVAPLMGLLGTVTGMIDVFNVLAVSGGGDVRAMAGGVSRATIPTMAGMVAAYILSQMPP